MGWFKQPPTRKGVLLGFFGAGKPFGWRMDMQQMMAAMALQGGFFLQDGWGFFVAPVLCLGWDSLLGGSSHDL